MEKPQTTDWQDANLDVLRAVAVFAVLVAHTLLVLKGAKFGEHFAFGIDMYSLGQLGVLIFFVHTALVLMRSLERMKLTGVELVGRFYTRRAFRIYPLSVSLVILTVAFSIPPYASRSSLYEWHGWNWLAANLLLMQNIVNTSSVSGPLWSLPFEVQMYLVLPFIFLAIRRKGFGRLVLIYAAGLVLSRINYLLLFLPCFLAGVIAYKLSDIVRPRFSAWIWLPALISLVFVRLLLPWVYPMQEAGPLVIGLIIPLFKKQCGIIATVASHVAKYSYGIYLWHTPILWLFYRKLTLPAWERSAWFLLCICLFPVASYHLIEHPMIQIGKHLTDVKKKALPTAGATHNEPDPECEFPTRVAI